MSVAPPLGYWAIQLPFGDLSKLGTPGALGSLLRAITYMLVCWSAGYWATSWIAAVSS